MAVAAAAVAVIVCAGLCAGQAGAGEPALSADQTVKAAGEPFYSNRFEKVPSVAGMTEVGRDLFFDRTLSASGQMSCASCHDPGSAYGPPNDLPVQLGGPDGRLPGLRAVPSLRYLQSVPPFTQHFFDSDGDDSVDQGPAGGRTWDGRSQSAHDQARLPLFSPLEMANSSPQAVVEKVKAAPYANRLREIFGEHLFADPSAAFNAVLLALKVFQQDPAEFYPYSSKYDAWLRGQARLNPSEERGLALFNDPAKGNCASCHPSGKKRGAFPQFTDYGYAALGVPRNAAIPANKDPNYFDLGLCGPLRTDFTGVAAYCGLFRVPSLRNVATRHVFFHNGAARSLEDAVRFYVQRDIQADRWYSRAADGAVRTLDDLPPPYRDNVNKEPPFGKRPGNTPALTDDEVNDVVAFLKTLTDGYQAAVAGNPAVRGQASN